MWVYLHFLPQLSFCLGSWLPVFEIKLGETQKVVSVRSARVDCHGTLELPDGGRHVVRVAVSASEKNMQRATISRDLLHLLEHCHRSNLVLRLSRLQQAHRQWVQVLNARLSMCDPCEGLDGLCVIPVLCERACEHPNCAKVVRICRKDLLCLLDCILEFACLYLGGP